MRYSWGENITWAKDSFIGSLLRMDRAILFSNSNFQFKLLFWTNEDAYFPSTWLDWTCIWSWSDSTTCITLTFSQPSLDTAFTWHTCDHPPPETFMCSNLPTELHVTGTSPWPSSDPTVTQPDLTRPSPDPTFTGPLTELTCNRQSSDQNISLLYPSFTFDLICRLSHDHQLTFHSPDLHWTYSGPSPDCSPGSSWMHC